MPYLLLVADPDENDWNVIAQADEADEIIDMVDDYDPSLRIVLNTDNYVTFPPKEQDNGTQ